MVTGLQWLSGKGKQKVMGGENLVDCEQAMARWIVLRGGGYPE